jgi:plastocyanin
LHGVSYSLKNHIIIAGSAIFLIIIIVIPGLISQPPSSELPPPAAPVINVTDTTQVSPESNALTPLITPVREPNKYSIKITVSQGFQPDVITIRESDIIVWNNEENQRTRVVLISKDGLFENKIMQYTDKYYYQFNRSGNYSFVLAEHNTLNEYPKAAFNVVVN